MRSGTGGRAAVRSFRFPIAARLYGERYDRGVPPAGRTSPRPAVSTLNFGAGQTRANNALLMIDSDGFFTVENAAPADAHLIVDVSGTFD